MYLDPITKDKFISRDEYFNIMFGEEFKSATKLGIENEEKAKEIVKDKVGDYKKKSHDILKSSGVKNVKTNRGQWFD